MKSKMSHKSRISLCYLAEPVSNNSLIVLQRKSRGRVRLTRRRSIAFPTADWIARQITEAFPWESAPRYLIRDRDRVFGSVVRQRLRAMGIRDKPIAPRAPWQN